MAAPEGIYGFNSSPPAMQIFLRIIKFFRQLGDSPLFTSKLNANKSKIPNANIRRRLIFFLVQVCYSTVLQPNERQKNEINRINEKCKKENRSLAVSCVQYSVMFTLFHNAILYSSCALFSARFLFCE